MTINKTRRSKADLVLKRTLVTGQWSTTLSALLLRPPLSQPIDNWFSPSTDYRLRKVWTLKERERVVSESEINLASVHKSNFTYEEIFLSN